MAIKRTNIYLDEHLDRLLRFMAIEQGRSFTALVREVLLDYVKREGFPDPARVQPPTHLKPDKEHQAHMLRLLQQIHDSIETDLTPDEIEDLITEVSEEMRQERMAQQLVSSD